MSSNFVLKNVLNFSKCLFKITGIMTANERDILDKMPDKYGTFFIPLVWITKLANEARNEGRIRDDFALKTIIDVGYYKSQCTTAILN